MTRGARGKLKAESLWGIVGKYGLYFGSVHALRKVSVVEHENDTGQPWSERRRKGDRAVRVRVTYRMPR